MSEEKFPSLPRDHVLFVDDELEVLNSLKRGLMDQPYTCLFASSAKDALKILEEKKISVIVTDMRMPEMNGLKLLQEVTQLSPDTVKIVLSGYTQLQQVLATINSVDVFKFITKPWKLEEEFVEVIQQALTYYRTQQENRRLHQALEKQNQTYLNMLASVNERIQSAEFAANAITAAGQSLLALALEFRDSTDPVWISLLEKQTVVFKSIADATKKERLSLTGKELEKDMMKKMEGIPSLQEISFSESKDTLQVNPHLLSNFFKISLLLIRELMPGASLLFRSFIKNNSLCLQLASSIAPEVSRDNMKTCVRYANQVLGDTARVSGFNYFMELEDTQLSITVFQPFSQARRTA